MNIIDVAKLRNIDKIRKKLTMKMLWNKKYHFSEKPIEEVKTCKNNAIDYKPEGLWYSCGDSWMDYIVRESNYSGWCWEAFDEFEYVYELKLDMKKILKLKSQDDFKIFTRQFGVKLPSLSYKNSFLINWGKVSESYSGIQIDYIDDLSYDYLWYHRWDCASGCVFNKNAIKTFKQVYKF